MGYNSRSERCNPIKLLVTTFNNSKNLLGLKFYAYKMSPDSNPNPNPNRNNNNYLLDTIILLDTTFGSGGYNVRIGCIVAISRFSRTSLHVSITL